MALIELDLDAPPAPPPSRPPARYYRYVAVLACVLLVLTLGGAAPATAVLWRRAGLVPLFGASTSFDLVDGLIYTMDGNANRRTTTAFALDPVRKLWSVATPLHLDPSGTVIQDGAGLVAAGHYTLLQASNGTTVIDPGTGRIRWTTGTPVLATSGDVGVLQKTDFAPGTDYDQSSGDPGPLYWSEDGRAHTQPPGETVVRGVDLGSGRELWRVTERGSVSVVPAAGDGTGFLVVAADRLSLLAADTGELIREHPLPRFAGNDVSFPDLMGDLLVLRHDVSDTGAGTATAFDRNTLDQRWQVTEPGQDGGGGTCLGLPCEKRDGRLDVLDPATGVPAWSVAGNSTIFARGADALETRGNTDTPLRLRDARTGRVRVDLTGWQTLAGSDDDTPVVVFRAQPPAGRAGFGVLEPGASRVQLLGLSADRVQECSSDASVIACRTERGIEVWSYRV